MAQTPTIADALMGTKPASMVLSVEQEAIAVAFRQHTLLPLDDCLYALQETILHLLRSALHRFNEHLQAFLLDYNDAKHLKRLRGLTSYKFVCAQWQKNPTVFTRDLSQLCLELYEGMSRGYQLAFDKLSLSNLI